MKKRLVVSGDSWTFAPRPNVRKFTMEWITSRLSDHRQRKRGIFFMTDISQETFSGENDEADQGF
jgi:hypothetical protein